MFVAKNETTLGATTQDVVEIALHASPSNKLGIHQSNGSILLGKNKTTVACDHPRSRRKSIRRRFERSRGVRRNTKSLRHKRGRSLHIIHDKESIYVNTARGRSLHMFMKEITTQILWHTTSKLTREKGTA
jgi:hypothetical protein